MNLIGFDLLMKHASRAETESRLLLAYDDVESGLEGKRVYDLLARAMGPDAVVHLHIVKLGLLALEPVSKAASQDALRADVVMLATSYCDRIPLAVAWWLSDWTLKRNGRPGALVLLVPHPIMSEATFPAYHGQIRKLADEAGMDFFCAPHPGVASRRRALLQTCTQQGGHP